MPRNVNVLCKSSLYIICLSSLFVFTSWIIPWLPFNREFSCIQLICIIIIIENFGRYQYDTNGANRFRTVFCKYRIVYWPVSAKYHAIYQSISVVNILPHSLYHFIFHACFLIWLPLMSFAWGECNIWSQNHLKMCDFWRSFFFHFQLQI